MATHLWGPEIAETYDATSAPKFEPDILEPTVDVLAELAGDGPALEFAIGTGRVALPLSERGVTVHGIELSPPMIDQLRAKPGSEVIAVTEGDMASTTVEGAFTLVYLVYNTIMNVTTQEEQIAVFSNAAAHLAPGGHFVVEVMVPQPQLLPDGDLGRVFTMQEDHLGVETIDDLVGQISTSHHWFDVDGRMVNHSAEFRYVWPSELDLMARLVGMRLQSRWADWERRAFTGVSTSHVSAWMTSAD